MRGVDRARLDKVRSGLQKDYQRYRRYLRDNGQLGVIDNLTGQLDRKMLYEMEIVGADYKTIKGIYQNIQQQLNAVGQKVEQLKRENRETIIRETPVHAEGSQALKDLEAAGLESKPLRYRIPKSVDRELEQTIQQVNAELEKYRNQSDYTQAVVPPAYDINKVREHLTDAESYKREIERLRNAYLDNPEWVQAFGTYGGGVMTKGERNYLQTFVDEENARRAEARKLLEEQEKRGYLPTEPEFATRHIDTSTYDAERLRRTANIYTDMAMDRRAAIWKENYLRSIYQIHEAVVHSGYGMVGKMGKEDFEKLYLTLVNLITNLETTEAVRRASLYGPEITIYFGDYDQIPNAAAHFENAVASLKELFGG